LERSDLDRTQDAPSQRHHRLDAARVLRMERGHAGDGTSGRRADLPATTRLPELVERARGLPGTGRRAILGVTGPPGAGKSTLARAIVDRIGETAEVVGMDGFHLAQSQLSRLGRLGRMGAIDTFDAAGFLALVRRLRDPRGEIVYAPEFRREIEEPVAGAVPVGPGVRLVVVEGNYLLASQPPWSELPPLFDEVWYVELEESVRLVNLIARHRACGKDEDEARRWAIGPDQRNAELIAESRPRADLVVRLNDG
jgi:pantothenate kinase